VSAAAGPSVAGSSAAGRSTATHAASRKEAPRNVGAPKSSRLKSVCLKPFRRTPSLAPSRLPRVTWRILAFSSIFATAPQMGSQQRSATRASGGFPPRRGDLFECGHDHPGHGVDPHKVIFDGLNPGNTFCGHADRAAVALIEQRARKVHDSVAHHDVNEADRRPGLSLEVRIKTLAD